MLVLSAAEQSTLLTLQEAVEAVAIALIEVSQKRTVTPVRTAIHVPNVEGTCLFMPSLVPAADGVGVKFVSVFPDNKAQGKPAIYGVMILADPTSGAPLALLEGSRLTASRTGAASGLATKYMARKDAACLGVIGTGVQARACIEAVAAVRPIEEIRLYNRTPQKASAMAAELIRLFDSQRPMKVHVVESSDAAVADADILVTATTSSVPVFDAKRLKPGVHINAVGSFKPTMQELPTEVFRGQPRVVVEDIDAALAETGDLQVPIARGVLRAGDIYGELGELAAGTKLGRQSDTEITVFKSVGLAAMDVAVARELYNRAVQLGLGQHVEL